MIQKTDDTIYDLVTIETNQRGYLISGDERFLQNLEDIRSRLNSNLEELKTLTQDNKEQAKRVDEFMKL